MFKSSNLIQKPLQGSKREEEGNEKGVSATQIMSDSMEGKKKFSNWSNSTVSLSGCRNSASSTHPRKNSEKKSFITLKYSENLWSVVCLYIVITYLCMY